MRKEKKKKAAEAEKKLLVFTHKQNFGSIFGFFFFSPTFRSLLLTDAKIDDESHKQMHLKCFWVRKKKKKIETPLIERVYLSFAFGWSELKRSNFIGIDYDGSYVYGCIFMKNNEKESIICSRMHGSYRILLESTKFAFRHKQNTAQHTV